MNVHPELAVTLDRLPLRPENPFADVSALRANFRALMAASDDGVDTRVEIEATAIPGPGTGLIDCHVIRPRGLAAPLPAVVYIHGGGFAYGELDGPGRMARDASVAAGAVVISPHYRLAPEHRFPAGLEDCYAVLNWVADHAADLGIDPDRIAVAGASAGGSLSAALCLLSRDRGGPSIAFQCLLIPVLDDRPLTRSRQAITDARVTNGPGVERMWDTYLGADRDPARTSIYAAPGRAADLSGLPPAYVLTCGLDPLRDEGLDYARRLACSGVPLQLHHVPGAWHFFEANAPQTELAKSTTRHWMRALHDALR